MVDINKHKFFLFQILSPLRKARFFKMLKNEGWTEKTGSFYG